MTANGTSNGGGRFPPVMPTTRHSAIAVPAQHQQPHQQQSQHHVQPPMSPESFAQKKNEIVQEMLLKIRPFVGPLGMLLPDAPMDGLCRVMEGEELFVQRSLIMTILLNSLAILDQPEGAEDGKAMAFLLASRMVRSTGLVKILVAWLQDSLRLGEVPLTCKVLEFMNKLPLTLDQLVELKLGKLIKRLKDDDKLPLDIKKASLVLFDKWSKQLTEDNNQQSQKRRFSAESNPEESTVQPVQQKTRAELILERAATRSNSQSGAVEQARPMSADDIHKAKRRQLYRQEFESNATEAAVAEVVTPPQATEATTPASSKKKRVSFPMDDAKLVQVRFFEPDIDVEPHTHSHDYHQADRQEASFAFARLSLAMDAEMEWRDPSPLKGIKGPPTVNSAESKRQAERESQSLSVIYYDHSMIPASPSESLLSHSASPVLPINQIPLNGADPPVVHVIGKAATVNPFLDPQLLSMLSNQVPKRPPAGIPRSQLPPFVRPPVATTGLPQPTSFPPMRRPPAPTSAQNPEQFKTIVCRYYIPGKPRSCRFGTACHYIHPEP